MMNRLTTIKALGLVPALALISCSNPADPPGIDAASPDASNQEVSDPLSMPLEPTVDAEDFNGAAACGSCHETHFAEWSTSMHSYGMEDPVYRALVALRTEAYDGLQDRFCLQCHTPIGSRSGDVGPNVDFATLQPVSLEAVNCESCHRITSVERPYNAGFVLDPKQPIGGSIREPVSTPAHQSEFRDVFTDSLLCGSCHDVVEVDGLNLERPYAEWLESPAFLSEENCQSCHMQTYTGVAAAGAPERTLHQHFFVGVGLPTEESQSVEERQAAVARVSALLQGAATVELDAEAVAAGEQIDLFVTVTNQIKAHNFPTGSTFNRQAWLEVIATDGNDAVIYETGTLDENGDLRNFWSDIDPFGDNDLIEFGSRFTDLAGDPTVLTWEAAEHHTNSLSPLYERTHTLFIPTSPETVGPIHIEARIRFRGFPPFLIRLLELTDQYPTLEIFDVDSISIDVALEEP